jgi:hypothetical protein
MIYFKKSDNDDDLFWESDGNNIHFLCMILQTHIVNHMPGILYAAIT